MKKNTFFRIILLVFAFTVIMPFMFNFEAEAGTGSEDNKTYSNVWLLTTEEEKYSSGSSYLTLETYVKNEQGEYETNEYIPSVTVRYDVSKTGSGEPGNSTVTVENGYEISRLELWNNKNNSKEGQTSSDTLRIDMVKDSNKTLKIFIDEKFDDEDDNSNDYSGGEILLNKTATSTGDIASNEFNLNFSVKGTPITKGMTADIVLVLDKSSSMKENISSGKSKAEVLEEAADRFIDSVLTTSGTNRVAIVAYSGDDDGEMNDSVLLQDFTTNKTTAKNSFNNFESRCNGGTNSESGFIMARKAFSSNYRSGAERFVIYMTDGESTFYYDENGSTVGNGNSFDVSAKNAAIEEANLLKDFGGQGVKIYTVGLSSSNSANMRSLLEPSQNAYQTDYYHATTADNLKDIYKLLADTIINTIANNAVVTDELPEGFELVNTLPGGVTFENGTIRWSAGSITNNLLEKNINFRYIGDNYGIKYANEGAEIEYIHVLSADGKLTKVKFGMPLTIVTPNVPEYEYYTNKGENIIITPPDRALLNDAGSDYTVSDLKIRVGKGTSKPNSSVSHNADNSVITFIPQSQGYPEDSFSYFVYFNVSSASDPLGLIDGTSQTFEKEVKVIINPHPAIDLTINYYETAEGVTKPLKIDGVTSVNKKLPKKSLIDEIAPQLYGYSLVDIDYVNIENADIIGRRITGQLNSSNATINFYYERDNSLVMDNVLINNSMYKNNRLDTTGSNPYNVIPGVSYRFGFKFKAGLNVDGLNIGLSGDTDKFSITNFSLYDNDQGDLLVGGPVNNFELLKSLIYANGTYTVTYTVTNIVRPEGADFTLNSSISEVIPEEDVPASITIKSIKSPELE